MEKLVIVAQALIALGCVYIVGGLSAWVSLILMGVPLP